MVVRANKHDANIGGHLATYASLATMLEVGYNHFFRGSYPGPDGTKAAGDFVYFQGHASPECMAGRFWKAAWRAAPGKLPPRAA
jgi:pyruvate dehydrogenase E1 component